MIYRRKLIRFKELCSLFARNRKLFNLENTPNKLTIGLSMIVKNESHVIIRLLNSVYKHIDYWAIADTGSTDGTQDLIRNFFEEKGIPGELIETPWVNFSACRNISLEAIEKKNDYGIWIDADEEFIPGETFDIQIALQTGLDTISIPTKYGGVDYTRKSIWKCGRGFKWNGPIHEILASPTEKDGGILHGAYVLVKAEGHSWKDVKTKYTDHGLILEKYTEVDPDPRWVFYTAQSWRDASEHQKSFDWYEKRSKLSGGFPEEVFFSLFMMARLAEIMGKERSMVMSLYNQAHRSDPLRGEPIKWLIMYLQRNKEWETAYIYSKYGLRYNTANPYPNRILFIDIQLYAFQMLELHSISCFNTHRVEEGSAAYWQMRVQVPPGSVVPEQFATIVANEKYFLAYDNVKHILPAPAVSGEVKTGIPFAGKPPQLPVPKPRGSNSQPGKKKRKK